LATVLQFTTNLPQSHIGCRLSIGGINDLKILKFDVRIFTYFKPHLRTGNYSTWCMGLF